MGFHVLPFYINAAESSEYFYLNESLLKYYLISSETSDTPIEVDSPARDTQSVQIERQRTEWD